MVKKGATAWGLIVILMVVASSCGAMASSSDSSTKNILQNTNMISVPGDYEKIQWAIDNATTGDTIVVSNGPYNERLEIDRQLNLTGIGLPEVTSVLGATVIRITADQCVVRGFKFSGARGMESGIKITSNHNRILANEFFDNKIGLSITLSNNNTITDNTFQGYVEEIDGSVKYGPGISLGTAHNNTISNNVGLGSYDSISLGKSHNNTIKDNTGLQITLGDIIVATYHSNNNTITNNSISNHKARAGIELHGCNNNITGNKITNQRMYGIMVGLAEKNGFINNTVLYNPWGGFDVDKSNNNTFEANKIKNNGYGFYLSSDFNNTFIRNNVTENNKTGFYLYRSNNNTVTDNDVTNNAEAGIYLSATLSSSYNNITSNNASGNDYDGIRISCENNTVTENTASGNGQQGIYLYFAHNSTVSKNVINDNQQNGFKVIGSTHLSIKSNKVNNSAMYGIFLNKSINNTIYNNYFNNTNNSYDDGNSTWNITKTAGTNIGGGPYLGGNYWSDYNGTDKDGDKLGDTLLPYNCSGSIQFGGDWHPLIKIPKIILKASKDGYASVKQEIDNDENFEQIVVSGIVADESTGEPIEDAKVEIVKGAQPASVFTNAKGNYTITAIIPEGSGSDTRDDVNFELPPAEYIITVDAFTAEIKQAIEDNNGTVLEIFNVPDGVTVLLLVNISKEEHIEPFLENVGAILGVKSIDFNAIGKLRYVPNDPEYPVQWGPQRIKAGGLPNPSGWDAEKGDKNVTIAIIDSGVDYTHPDLAPNYKSGGYDWVNDDNDPIDDNGHGTNCAGIAAAVMDNNVNIAGLAQCNIIAEKASNNLGNSQTFDIIRAIHHAAELNADVISMSFGGINRKNRAYENAIGYAWHKGCILVAANGYEGLPLITYDGVTPDELGSIGLILFGHFGDAKIADYPPSFKEVIAVGAIDPNGALPQYSFIQNYGSDMELVAPGITIRTTRMDGGTETVVGTSFACPHVSGTAALLKSRAKRWPPEPLALAPWYHLNNEQIRKILQLTAEDLGPPGWDERYGYGLVDAKSALRCVNISGNVLEALLNAPIPHPPEAPAPPEVRITSIEGPPGIYSTNENTTIASIIREGDYHVRVPPGVYSICAMAYGYIPSRGLGGERLELPAFDFMGNLYTDFRELRLVPFPCNVTGNVTDNATGLPRKGASISLDGPPHIYPPHPNVHMETKSNSNGNYHFILEYSVHPPYPVGEAVYNITVTKPGYESQTQNFTLNWSDVVKDYYKCPLDPRDYNPPIVNFSLVQSSIPLPDLTITSEDIQFILPSSNSASSPSGQIFKDYYEGEMASHASNLPIKEELDHEILFKSAVGTITSSWTTSTPLIDGTLESDEWVNATKMNITYHLGGNCSMLVMNDEENLYIAFDVVTDTTNDVNVQDVVQLGFDGDHDNLTAPYDTHPFYAGGTCVDLVAQIFGDDTQSWAGFLNLNEAGTECELWWIPSNPTGSQVLATGFSNHRTYEYALPLASALNVSAGDAVGFNVLINDGLGTPEADDFITQGLWPSTWNGLCDFTADGDLILATAPITKLATLTATTHNIGTADASDIIVQFFDGDPNTGGLQIGRDQTISNIPAGGTGSAQVSWDITDKVGSHLIYVRIDPYNTTTEFNEDNNYAIKQIGVPGVTCSDPNVTIDRAKTSVTDDPVGDGYDLSDAPANVNLLNAKGFNITATGPNGAYLFNITFLSPVLEGFVLFKLPEWTAIPYAILDTYTIQVRLNITNGVMDPAFVLTSVAMFDTETPLKPYPSISGVHNGTITPNQTIVVSQLYTYPCSSTGGHTSYVRIWNSSWDGVEAHWNGYQGDWHYISFDNAFTLYANKTYYYTIETGSYPQIHHTDELEVLRGTITCTEFVDVNGKQHEGGIPAIKLY